MIGTDVPKRLASRLGLDLPRAWIEKDGQDGKEVKVSGRCNGVCQEFRLPIEALRLKVRQKKQLGL